jgi:arginase
MADSQNLHVTLITVPYDSGHFAERMGNGPLHIMDQLPKRLTDKKHEVTEVRVQATPGFLTEATTAFDLQKKIKESVGAAIHHGTFPLVLSGNCNATVGTVAGLNNKNTGVIWFDAHGDLETPDTTTTGFLDGMALSVLLGRCWHNKITQFSYQPLPANHIILIGARDMSEAEKDFIRDSGIHYVTVSQIQNATDKVESALASLIKAGVTQLHIHLDVDVIDPSEGEANSYSSPGGLTSKEVIEAIRFCCSKLSLRSAGITSYDPECDTDGRILNVILEAVDAIVEGAKLKSKN